MTQTQLIHRLKEVEVIYRERVKLRSGLISNFYCDIKKAYGYPDILNALADQVGKLLTKQVTCIVASGYGGLPLASVVASRFNKKLVLVRDTPKKHGRGGYVDGYKPTKRDVIVILDDVLTTGSSIKKTMAGLRTLRVKAKYAIVVVKRGEAKLSIPVKYVFTINEIVM